MIELTAGSFLDIVPPITVCLLTGPEIDTIISCFLFLCGVIPSHIHGFYLSCTYFHRRKKARKGRYPGPPCTFIYDHRVWNGGLSDAEVEYRRTKEQRERQRRNDEKSSVARRRNSMREKRSSPSPPSARYSRPPMLDQGQYVPPSVQYPGSQGSMYAATPSVRHSGMPAYAGRTYRR